jgi:hypothetical protein
MALKLNIDKLDLQIIGQMQETPRYRMPTR